MFSENKSDTTIKSYQISSTVYDKLNIVYKAESNVVALWNKYQIILYREHNLNEPYDWITTDFIVHKLILTKNHIICLDVNNNLHRRVLETHSSKKKQLKNSFQQFDTNIYSLTQDNNFIYTLKYKNNVRSLVIYTADDCFTKLSENKLLINSDLLSNYKLMERIKLKCVCLKDSQSLSISSHLQANNIENANVLVIMTLDSFNIYGCLLNDHIDREIELVSLYSTPSEVADIEVCKEDNFHVILGLKCGVILKFNLLSNKLEKTIHLNGDINKFVCYNDCIIHNDGLLLCRWNNNDIIDQFPLHHIKDFLVTDNKLLAVSYHNVLYELSLTENHIKDEEYFSTEQVLNNEDSIKKVFELVKVNDAIIQEINRETNYITAFAIAQNESRNLIAEYSINLYENFSSIKDLEITYVDNLDNYYKHTIFLIKVSLTKNPELYKILNSIIDKLRINIIVSSKEETLKTVTTAVSSIKDLNLALTLNVKASDIKLKIILLATIPANSIEVPTVLSFKEFDVGCVNFIQTHTKKIANNKNIDIDPILESAKHWYGNLVEIEEPTNKDNNWQYYIQLPENYNAVFENINNYKSIICREKVDYIKTKLSGKEFLKGGSQIKFDFGAEKVTLEISDSDHNKKVLIITSCDIDIAYNMKKFISNLICESNNTNNSEMCVPHKQYYIIENLDRNLNQLMEENSNPDEIYEVAKKFEERVLSYLPI